jgi:formamidopyrimidine-DNA glycosylase
MPELPEVETIARRLNTVLPTKVITELTVFHPKSFKGHETEILNHEIKKVSRKAKIIIIELSNQLFLLIHLKMTGQLIYSHGQTRIGGGHPTADWVSDLPSKHTRIQLSFADGSQLFFNDQRLFGWIKVADDEYLRKELVKFGPDIIDPSLTAETLFNHFKKKSVAIKVALLDPSIVAGLGNIYVCDALNVAQIDPFRPSKSLSLDEVKKVLEASRQTVEKGIELGGTTFDGMYVDIDGFAGKYQGVVRVYGRENKPCLNCGNLITKKKLAGRGTYYCPSCQT